uniref:Movement protein n=1 Tax=Mesocestoides corti TaxID=53468 RepID=A0A5K3FC44_MESCO
VNSPSLIRPLQPPTQRPSFRSLSPAARIINSPPISSNDYPRLSSHLGLNVGTSMTHI